MDLDSHKTTELPHYQQIIYLYGGLLRQEDLDSDATDEFRTGDSTGYSLKSGHLST